MKSIIMEIRERYGEMGPGERKIADCLLDDPGCLLSLSISEFCARVGVGDATAVRFARRLGLNGYQNLRIAVAKEVSSISRDVEMVRPGDSCYDIFNKRINDVQVALENTRSVLDPQALERAAQAVMTARRVVIFGLGNSASIANDAQHKFLRLGLDAVACSDNHLQAIIASHLDNSCVAIGISHSGKSVDIVQALKIARLGGATCVCVTNHEATPVTAVSDICLFTKSAETEYSILAMSSRIAQLTIFDAIYTYIVANSDVRSANAIRATELALKEKKY